MDNDNEAVPVERISMLVRNRCCTRILLLIYRIWDAMITGRNGDFEGVYAIGIDKEGNAIHIVIDRSISESLRDILKEGEVYIFSNIGCIPATNYRPVIRPERLRFNSATEVQVHENFAGTITRHFFEFQSFATADTRLKDTFLTDLIGVIAKIEDPSGGYTKHDIGQRDIALASYKSVCSKSGQPIWVVAENYRFKPTFAKGNRFVADIGDMMNVQVIIDGYMNTLNPYLSSSWRRKF